MTVFTLSGRVCRDDNAAGLIKKSFSSSLLAFEYF